MTRTAILLVSCAALGAGAAFAQDGAAPAADPHAGVAMTNPHGGGDPHAGVTMPDDPVAAPRTPGLGFAPMFLELGPDETIGLPRGYDQRECGNELMAKLFAGEVGEDFLNSLRCYRVPVERSEEFALTLDQAIAQAGWRYDGEAGEIVHYRRGAQTLDTRIFWVGTYGEPESQDRGFLFGVVGERDAEAE